MIQPKLSDIYLNIKRPDNIFLYFTFILIASALDYIILYGQKTSALIMLIITIGTFFIAHSHFKIGRNTILLSLVFNTLILFLSINTKIYTLNIFLLSFPLWYLITPYVNKFKGLHSIFLPVLLLSSYLFPFYSIKIPVFPLVIYPVYLLGYALKEVKITKVKYGIPVLLFNLFASSAGMFFFLSNTKDQFPTDNLRLISLNASYETSVYQPYWGILLVWL